MEESNEPVMMNTNSLKYHNHIYNIKEGMPPFQLQFKQLKYYYNLRKKFKNILSQGLNPQNNVVENEYCLIDKMWLKKWKKHVGYKEIKNKIKETKNEKDLDDKDYKWIAGIIDKNYKENYLNPLDNNTIYKDNEINPLADFKVIHKDSLDLFIFHSESSDKNINERTYPISFFKDKYLIDLNKDMLLIAFKTNNSKKYNEIIGEFVEIKEKNNEGKYQNEEIEGNKNTIIGDCINKDINQLLKEINFNSSEIEQEIKLYNCKIKIYNKTLLKKFEGNKMENSVFPNINNERNELLNINSLSNELTKMVEMQCQFTQFFLRDIKNKIDNDNSISTNIVFGINKNKKQGNPIINLGNNGKNDNNKIEESNNENNLGETKMLLKNREDIINNKKNQSLSSNQNDRNKQSENISHNNNQQILSHNQNNNFNNQNISQNNNNNANYYNNQNKFQNFNNAFQNNMNMNNNQQFNQQNNQINAKNNMLPQNNLLLNSCPDLKCNNGFPNLQNYNLMVNNNSPQNYNFNYFMNMMNFYNNLMNNFQNNNNNINGIKYPHKSGLENIGQTCYMNATIECLSNIKEITDYLLCLNENFISKKNSLTLSYRSLLVELFLTGQKTIVPEIFKSVIGELNPLFQGKHAADSKDLLFFLIERLHLENNVENKNIPNVQKNFYQLELESRFEKLMFQNFLNDSKLKANSIFSKTFYGITESIMDCKGCGVRKFSFQSFNMQIFQLKKLKEDKLLNFKNNGSLNLLDAFVLQQMPELLINDNMIYCNNCKGLNNGVHQQFIYELPKVLIIILNRGRNNADFNEGFDFPPILDLRNQNVIINPNSPKLFYLCGVITHLGESGIGGHFIAYCRNNMNDNFTIYNDSVVSEVSINEAISYNISNNEAEKRTPYILFYHYI